MEKNLTHEIIERNIKIEFYNFTEMGYQNAESIFLTKMKGQQGYNPYPSINNMKLTAEQESLLLQFINSL